MSRRKPLHHDPAGTPVLCPDQAATIIEAMRAADLQRLQRAYS